MKKIYFILLLFVFAVSVYAVDIPRNFKLKNDVVTSKEIVKKDDCFEVTTTIVEKIPISKIESFKVQLQGKIKELDDTFLDIKEAVNWVDTESLTDAGVNWSDIQYNNEDIEKTLAETNGDYIMVYKDGEGGEVWVPADMADQLKVTTIYEVTKDKKENRDNVWTTD